VQSVDWSPTTKCALPDQETSEKRPYAPQGATGSKLKTKLRTMPTKGNTSSNRKLIPGKRAHLYLSQVSISVLQCRTELNPRGIYVLVHPCLLVTPCTWPHTRLQWLLYKHQNRRHMETKDEIKHLYFRCASNPCSFILYVFAVSSETITYTTNTHFE
jgi:hypothetical protein